MRFFMFMVMFWFSVLVDDSQGGSMDSENSVERKKRVTPRGYYGGLGYPYLPFAEPLTILAGLAFLAYIIQAFHAFYHQNHGGGLGGGLGGGILNNVLPSKSRSVFSRMRDPEEIITFTD